MTEVNWSLLVTLLVGLVMMSVAPIMLVVERRGSAWMQRRSGPNRVGPWGLLQPMADALKLVFKESNIPARAHKALFVLAPGLAVFPPFVAMVAIPLGGSVNFNGVEYPLQALQSSVGILFFLAITSLHVYSVLTAGWASNNKFSLMGSLRSSSQMISYEIAIGICIVSLVMTYGTLDLREIVALQEHGARMPAWGVFLQPVCFLLLWVASFAETNRLPFDLPEGESELVAGYHTEYSGLKWALFFLGEYAAMFASSAFLVTLFFGGYHLPFISEAGLREFFMGHGLDLTWASAATVAIHFATFIFKVAVFMWLFVWVRWTLPRFRYDQLMDLGWKIMLPIGVANAIVTMLYTYIASQGA
jgi:NADH-quinone oxidoreductase subunit H